MLSMLSEKQREKRSEEPVIQKAARKTSLYWQQSSHSDAGDSSNHSTHWGRGGKQRETLTRGRGKP